MSESRKPNVGNHNQLLVELAVVRKGVARRFGEILRMIEQDQNADSRENEALRQRTVKEAASLDKGFERLLKRVDARIMASRKKAAGQ